ncbi:replication/maintenance protein RepL [Paenibacillus sp. FSL P2-0536]|uniref:replication/maintenance protein RepL n=1 Tax=Paenibacillus sp. FSL P2-0536 TaxID=2921629 RepID=UPI0030F65683
MARGNRYRGRNYVSNVYWGAIVFEFFRHLQDHDLSAVDHRILFYMCEKMDTNDNLVHVRQITIARELNIDKANVSRSLKKLCHKQFILKYRSEGYMVNPHLLYGGNGWKNKDMLRQTFDNLTDEPRFYLNDDDKILEDSWNTRGEELDDPLTPF